MSDRMTIVVAVATVLGALTERGPSPWLGGTFVVLAFAVHRPWLLALASFVLAGGLGARAAAGLAPITPAPFAGTVTVLSDPETFGGGVRFDVRTDDGRHLEARVLADAAVAVARERAAGERLTLAGRVQRAPPASAPWLRVRHVAGVLAVDTISGASAGGVIARAANAVRATLTSGASALRVDQRPLFLGFVLGDTRGETADVTDDYRAAGLTHLLAVSGENVAFVLALAGPVLRRLPLRSRLVATLAVIAFFALVTRFEPSVLRASAMAALAVTAATLGREASRLRLLALAVALLVLVDPFLVRSVGFQLSVGASLGIVLVAPAIADRLPGPRAIADALAVTVAAQVGVAPMSIAAFGGVPLASVPANLLAAPAAAAVMVWGVGAGLVAGVAGGPTATLLHQPTSLLIGWISAVAHGCAALPLGELDGRNATIAAVGAVVAVVATRVAPWARPVRWCGVAAAVAAVASPVAATAAPPSGPVVLGRDATVWRSGGGTVLEVDGGASTAALFTSLRRAGVRSFDVVVVRSSSSRAADVVAALQRWGRVTAVVVPVGAGVPGATVVAEPTDLAVGDMTVALVPSGGGLVVDIARGPPV